jgi:hypothetical protein
LAAATLFEHEAAIDVEQRRPFEQRVVAFGDRGIVEIIPHASSHAGRKLPVGRHASGTRIMV